MPMGSILNVKQAMIGDHMAPKPIKYSEIIAKKVELYTKNGVSVKDILASIQRYQDAPKGMATFYKYYGHIRSEAKADITSKIGNVVVQSAIGGDLKAAELYLRSKGGWSPHNTINEVDQEIDPDVDETAIDTLVNLLGIQPNEENDKNE